MLLSNLKFFTLRQFIGKPIRLAMTLLVKNEIELIESNIRYHASIGVDCFVVMDNGSEDGTLELLQKLSQEFELFLISRPVGQYRQSDWRTEMALVAREKLKADWVIANDADEFWVVKNGDLKQELSRTKSIIECQRFDVQLDKSSEGQPFYERIYRTQYPIEYGKGTELYQEDMSVQLSKIHGKVIVNLQGMVRLKGGNHRAWHLWAWINQCKSQNIFVYHYALGSRSHFEKHVKNRKELLKNGARMGNHYRRWVKMMDENKLNQEWDRLVLDEKAIEILKKYGVIVEDNYARDKIYEMLGPID